MAFLGLLIVYTVFVLYAQGAVRRLRQRVREHGAEALVIQVPRLRDVGWGAALVPVTIGYLWAFGTFSMFNPGGANNGHLFSATTPAGAYLYSLLTVAVVAAFALVQPRRAGYLAAAGLTVLGMWILFEAAVFPHYTYDLVWYGWLRDQLRWPMLALVGSAGLAGGFFLTRRTIVADARARRGGLTARVERLTQARAEVVDSAAAELRRLERDLHDGAQARLVALGINLRTAEKLITTSPDAAASLVAECRDTATLALSELRDLVRGIYPPVLADRGLGDALRALALDCPVPATADIQLRGRPPAPVESAVYFAVAEALSNAAKHAQARSILVRLDHDGHMLRAEVHDDGVGGADPGGAGQGSAGQGSAGQGSAGQGSGTGLAGMERRLGAFDGILAVSSPIGGPTVVAIEVPCELSSPKISTS